MYCTNCGSELPADARFCPSCSYPVEVEQSGLDAEGEGTAGAKEAQHGQMGTKNASPASKRKSKAPVVAIAVAAVLAACVLAVGLATNWYGRGPKQVYALVATAKSMGYGGGHYWKYENDSQGNRLSAIYTTGAPYEPGASSGERYEYELDEFGNIESFTVERLGSSHYDDGSYYIESDLEYDDKDRLSMVYQEEPLSRTFEFSYDASDRMTRESIVFEADTETDEYPIDSEYTFDSDGYCQSKTQTKVQHRVIDGKEYATTYETKSVAWQRDFFGNPTACTVTTETQAGDDEGELVDVETVSETWAVTCDAHGNITRMEKEGADGSDTVCCEYEYSSEPISNPSPAVLQRQTKPINMLD